MTASVAVAAIALTACTPGTGGATATSGPVEITWWSNLGGMDAVAAAYNASQSDVHVTLEVVPAPESGGTQKLSNALKAGNAPCAATIATGDIPSFVTEGGLLPLSDVPGGDVVDSFPQSAKDTVQIGGSTWAFPQATGAMVYFYRQDVFDKAGITVPTTWAEFRDAAAAMKKAKPGTYIGSFVNQDVRFITGLVSQNGAQWFSTANDQWSVDITSPESLKVADYWQGLVDDDLVNVMAAGSADWNYLVTNDQLVGFLGGPFNAAGIVALAPGQAGDWRVAPMPSWGDGASGGFGGVGIGITKDCKNPAEAAKFATWLTTDPAAVRARSTVGSSYPAFPAQAKVASEVFMTADNKAFFGGEDIYSVFDKGAAAQKPFVWGPTMPGTTAALIAGYASITRGGTLSKVFSDVQDQTVTQMTDAGLLK